MDIVLLIKQFKYYKSLGDKSISQVSDKGLFWQYNAESNSIAIIVKHLAGNMLSRWTDFLVSDGEKEWRNRESEFVNNFVDRDEMLVYWEKGWQCLFNALDSVTHEDIQKLVYIRNMGHTVEEAINRQIAHYAYHVGQIVFIAKMQTDSNWQSLTIPKGASESYNKVKFSTEKRRKFFSDEEK